MFECWRKEAESKDLDEEHKDLLTEAEEERVHAHGVHAEEAVGDEVGSHYQSLGKTITYMKICNS